MPKSSVGRLTLSNSFTDFNLPFPQSPPPPDIFSPLSPLYTHPLTTGTIYIGTSLCLTPPILSAYKITKTVDCSKTPSPKSKTNFPFDLSSSNPQKLKTDAQIIEFLAPLLQFLDECRSENVLVHCLSGSQRSGTVAIICLMRYLGLNDVEEVSKTVKNLRPVCEPNSTGWEIIKRFAKARENGEDLELNL
ncbi:hypothetical protein TrVE_jg8722 [Triparma verrucosa]|uniref:Tyrosine specific protein phosphatases domain-containing protein n=1 Tax=Triparma verrucosa TaxID=1606542 RepID=A0A9W7B849_9STRA|nr:hypothetical protein TrVE_jg8722 [Triparma verrucosa]